MMRAIDLRRALATLVFAVDQVAAFGPGLLNVIIAVSLEVIGGVARVVGVARSTGFRHGRIFRVHIRPSAMAPSCVLATVSGSCAILAAATLSTRWLGGEATTPSWGLVLADGRSVLARARSLGGVPGLAITLAVLSSNGIGEWPRYGRKPV